VSDKAQARIAADYDLVDLADHPLPHMDEPMSPMLRSIARRSSHRCDQTASESQRASPRWMRARPCSRWPAPLAQDDERVSQRLIAVHGAEGAAVGRRGSPAAAEHQGLRNNCSRWSEELRNRRNGVALHWPSPLTCPGWRWTVATRRLPQLPDLVRA
jgi:hypothetical protein